MRKNVGEKWIVKKLIDIGEKKMMIKMIERREKEEEMVKEMRYKKNGVSGVG